MKQQSSLYDLSLDQWGLRKDEASFAIVNPTDQKIHLVDLAYSEYNEIASKYNLYKKTSWMFYKFVIFFFFAMLFFLGLFILISFIGVAKDSMWKFTIYSLPAFVMYSFLLLFLLSLVSSGRYNALKEYIKPQAREAKDKLLNDLKKALA